MVNKQRVEGPRKSITEKKDIIDTSPRKRKERGGFLKRGRSSQEKRGKAIMTHRKELVQSQKKEQTTKRDRTTFERGCLMPQEEESWSPTQ